LVRAKQRRQCRASRISYNDVIVRCVVGCSPCYSLAVAIYSPNTPLLCRFGTLILFSINNAAKRLKTFHTKNYFFMQVAPEYLYAVPRLFRLTEPVKQPDGTPAYQDGYICVYVSEIGIIAACSKTLYRINTARFEFSRVKGLDKSKQFYLCRFENVREYKPRKGNYQPPVRLMNDMSKRTAFLQSRRLNRLLVTSLKLSAQLKERAAARLEKDPLKDPYYTLFYGSLSRELCRLSNAGGSFMYNDVLYILCRAANKHYQYKNVCSELAFQ